MKPFSTKGPAVKWAAIGALAGVTLAVLIAAAVHGQSHSGRSGSGVAAVAVAKSPADESGSPGRFAATNASPPPIVAPTGLTDLHCPAASVTVSDGPQLQDALDAARPGTVIALKDGIYLGYFHAQTAGTRSSPVYLCGSRAAILDGAAGSGSSEPPYGLHLTGASWWRLVGFSLRNSQKGLVLDHSSNDVIHGLTLYNIGEEAVHLRAFSSDDVIEGCVIRGTGLEQPKFGEGIYIGSAVSNWSRYTAGQPDQSDRVVIRYNNISLTTAENIDIKEGTSDGDIAFNRLNGQGMHASAATSWIDVKGVGYHIEDNFGQFSLENGFSTYQPVFGSGVGNTFADNQIGPGVTGYGFQIDSGNTVMCNNSGAGKRGLSNRACTPNSEMDQ